MNKSKGSQGPKKVQGTIYWKGKDINEKTVNLISKRRLITIGLGQVFQVR